MKRTITTLLLLLLCQGLYAEETVYVHDMLRLGVRAVPDTNEGSITVVSTGDALTVLGEREGYLNVRTESGLEGWVSKSYVSNEPPARLQLQALQASHNQLLEAHQTLQRKHDTLQQQLAQRNAQGGQENGQLKQLQEENGRLRQQLEQLNQSLTQKAQVAAEPAAVAAVAEPSAHPTRLILSLLGLALLTAVGGFFYGVRWKSRRVAERLGGLQI